MSKFTVVLFLLITAGGLCYIKSAEATKAKCATLAESQYARRQAILRRTLIQCDGPCMDELAQLQEYLVKFDSQVLALEGCGQ